MWVTFRDHPGGNKMPLSVVDGGANGSWHLLRSVCIAWPLKLECLMLVCLM